MADMDMLQKSGFVCMTDMLTVSYYKYNININKKAVFAYLRRYSTDEILLF